VDSIWDAIHTFICVPAGTVLAASAFAHFYPAIRVVALLARGTLALGSHGTKACVRMTANASPGTVFEYLLNCNPDVRNPPNRVAALWFGAPEWTEGVGLPAARDRRRAVVGIIMSTMKLER